MPNYDCAEFEKIREKFPGLYYDQRDNSIKGILEFCAHYKNNSHTDIPEWDIEFCNSTEDDCIEGQYSIKIYFNEQSTHRLPRVFETEGKIEKSKTKWNIKFNKDIHLYRDGSCCLGCYLNEEISEMSLYEFVAEKVYSHFVGQAYFEKHGKEPPHKGLPHPLREAYTVLKKDAENDLENLQHSQIAKPKGAKKNIPCPCGSGKKYKKCCFRQDQKVESKMIKKRRFIREYKKRIERL